MIKTLELKLATLKVGVLQQKADPAAGWYVNPITGQRYYYDGQHLYALQNGIFVLAFTNRQTAPKVVTLAPGDKLKITLGFNYSGPAVSGAQAYFGWGYFGIVGNWAPTQEIWVPFDIPANPSSTPAAVQQSYTFTIPTGVSSGPADILVQVNSGSPDVGQNDFAYNLALSLVGVSPVITNFTISDFVKV